MSQPVRKADPSTYKRQTLEQALASRQSSKASATPKKAQIPRGSVYTSTGVRRSARLMTPEEIEVLTDLFDDSTDNDVNATLDDVAILYDQLTMKGRRRKMRGGVPVRQALIELLGTANDAWDQAIGATSEALGTAVSWIPTLVKGAVVGAAARFTVNNPTLFASILRMSSDFIANKLSDTSGASWESYAFAARIVWGAGERLTQALTAAPTPEKAFVIAFAIMKYRAMKANISMAALIKADAVALKELANNAKNASYNAAAAQYAAFLQAYASGSTEKPIAQLKELAKRANEDRPTGPGAAAMSTAALQTGAPSAQAGPAEDTIALVPARETDIVQALEKLASLDVPVPSDEKLAAQALLGLAQSEAPAAAMDTTQGGRRRRGYKKTRRAPKRRVTRRRKMLAAPVFAY